MLKFCLYSILFDFLRKRNLQLILNNGVFQSGEANWAQASSEVGLRDLQARGPREGLPAPLSLVARRAKRSSQAGLLTHSDGDIVVPVVLGDQGHHWPVPGGVGGVDRDELLSAILGEPIHLDGVAHSVGQEEHLDLRGEQRLKDAAGSPLLLWGPHRAQRGLA